MGDGLSRVPECLVHSLLVRLSNSSECLSTDMLGHFVPSRFCRKYTSYDITGADMVGGYDCMKTVLLVEL